MSYVRENVEQTHLDAGFLDAVDGEEASPRNKLSAREIP